MTRRCNAWDYRRRAIYMITLVQEDRRVPLLGRLEVADGAGNWVTPAAMRGRSPDPERVAARVARSPLGETIFAHWWRLGEFTPEIRPLYCVVMPDHLHGILEVTREMKRPLGQAIGGFKTGCEKLMRAFGTRELALPAQGTRELALPAQGTRELALPAQNRETAAIQPQRAAIQPQRADCLHAGCCAPTDRLWAEGYQDSILFGYGQLNNMFRYLKDNARRLAIKKLFPDFFRVTRRLKVPLYDPPAPHPNQPSANPSQPTTNPNQPSANPNQPAATLSRPTAQPQRPTAQPAQPQRPTAQPQQPTAQPAQPQRPTAQPAQPQRPTAQPAQPQRPTAQPAQPQRPTAHGQYRPICSVPEAQASGCVAEAQASGFFSALGNCFLLDRPLRQVQVSRRDFGYRREPKAGGLGRRIVRDAAGVPQVAFESPAFRAKREALAVAARRGAVLISPCVSDGEREIARLALAARCPLVTLCNKGFAPLQKPGGRHFEACCDGRLLMLAPIAWPYVPGEKPMTRADALILNRLAQRLAGDGAVEINYHGVTIENADRWALRAVC